MPNVEFGDDEILFLRRIGLEELFVVGERGLLVGLFGEVVEVRPDFADGGLDERFVGFEALELFDVVE